MRFLPKPQPSDGARQASQRLPIDAVCCHAPHCYRETRTARSAPLERGGAAMPAGKAVVGIAEIVLWTDNPEESLQFYHDLLGLEVISPPTLPNMFLKVG